MYDTRPKLSKEAEKRRASIPARPIYTPPPRQPKPPMSFVQWLGVLLLLMILGWFSGWAFSKWTQRNDMPAADAPKVARLKKLPTITAQYRADDGPADAAAAKDTAATFADKAFGAGPFRPGEVLLRENSDAELQALLARAQAAGGTLLGLIRGNFGVRFSFPDAASMARFLRGSGQDPALNPELNYTVTLPTQPDVPTDPYAPGGLAPFGSQALSYMGVPTDNADWGKGITVAMLDTGLSPGTPNILKGGPITQYDMTTGQSAPGVGHGDMVISLLTGANGEQGIVPASPIVSVRVLDSSGQGDVFGVTDGIYTAVDQGAKVLSLSLGTNQPSAMLLAAIDYALSQGVVVVAAAGNDGNGQISYPAAYPGVVAVGSIDATGQRATFSNYGNQMDLTAPGVGINTVTTDGNMSFSGTSASAPLVAGAIAGLLSTNSSMTGQQAVSLLVQYADAAGPVSSNSTANEFYGSGIVDVGRVLNRTDPNYTDLALADLYLNITSLPTGGTAPMQVSIQNRGNTMIGQASINVNIGGQLIQQVVTGLQPNEVRAITVSVPVAPMLSSAGLQVTGQASMGQYDANMNNNMKSRVVRLIPANSTSP